MMDDELQEIVAALLADPDPDYGQLIARLQQRQRRLQAAPLILNQVVRRLAATLRTLAEPAQPALDAIVLLRQLIRATGPVNVHTATWARLAPSAQASRLVAYLDKLDHVQVMALPWESSFVDNGDRIDLFESRTGNDACPGDGLLRTMSEAARLNWTTYRSAAQKAAVDCWQFAAPGATVLVTLPTGSGKSLCTLLPAWFASRGGRHSRGTTLVVVPTVALAIDQEKQAARFFAQAPGDLSKPISRTGDTSAEERLEIEAALRDGQLPIIYTSPESLLNSRLHDVCLQAAAQGLITRFVIDEAHLVASWGVGFRPEFQQLAAYRRQLLAHSQGQLRTLLLSATISASSRSVLERLFAEPGKLVVVQANRLRPEIGYWFSKTPSSRVRDERVLEALRILPRPLILYVTRPEQAQEWAGALRSQGYRRVGEFSGETDQDTRRQLIKRWDDNEIDVMVATSAFGLGVDKSDVRAVVHATLPENIDRYYQEVGRSGRDGYSAASLVCAVYNDDRDSDIGLVSALQARLITVEKALPRWLGMIRDSVVQEDVRWVDRDSTPINQPNMLRSERNRDWNDHILLLMQRAGLIEVVDAPPPQATAEGGFLNRLPIRIVDGAVFNDPTTALAKINPYREEEKEDAHAAANGIIELVRTYAGSSATTCLAGEFAQLYADVQEACGGCPACRAQGDPPYCPPLRFSVEYPSALRRAVAAGSSLETALHDRLGAWRTLNVTWQGPRTVAGLQPCADLLGDLVRNGIQQLIYPEELLAEPSVRDRVIGDLAQPDPLRPSQPHRLIPAQWIVDEDYPLFPLATAVIYPPSDAASDPLYRALRRLRRAGLALPALINILPEGLVLASEGKRFLEHVDGLTEPLDRLQQLLRRSQDLPEFF